MPLSSNLKPVSETTDDEVIEDLIALLRRHPDFAKKIVFDEYTGSEMIDHLERRTPIGMQFLEFRRRVRAAETEKGSDQELIQTIRSAIRTLNI